MRALRWIVTCCVLSCVVDASPDASARDDETVAQRAPASLDAMLTSLLDEHPLPGVAVLVVEGDRIVAEGCAGVRKLGGDVAVTIDDRWHLGSCTKAMTATVIARLVEQDRLDWNLTIAGALEEFIDAIHPKFRDVTLEQLISNRGGLPTGAPDLWPRIFGERSDDPMRDRRAMAKLILSRDHGPDVGEYQYSNFGFAIAGHMAETITGTPWEQLMREELFRPLGMEAAGFGLPWEGPDVTEPSGHRADGAPVKPRPRADNPPAIAPAGTVHASIRDWAKFISAHLVGPDGGETPLGLPAAAFRNLHRSRGAEGYAAGWTVTRRPWARGERQGDVGRVLTHAGSNTTYFSVVWLAPERDFAILACTNQGGDAAAKHLDAFVAAALAAYLTGSFTTSDSSTDAQKPGR